MADKVYAHDFAGTNECVCDYCQFARVEAERDQLRADNAELRTELARALTQYTEKQGDNARMREALEFSEQWCELMGAEILKYTPRRKHAQGVIDFNRQIKIIKAALEPTP